MFVHPDYHYGIYGIPFSDIAIVELENSVEMSDSIKPACIADYKNVEIDTNKGSVVTSGWGSTVECDKNCNSSIILQGTEMFLISRKICNKHATEHLGEELEDELVTDVMISANHHSRVCRGDSGVISATYIFVLIKWVAIVDYFHVAQFQISTLYLLVLNKVVKNNYISVE